MVEPDATVLGALEKNRKEYQYKIENKFISNNNKELILDGYGTRIENSDIKNDKNITWNDFKKKYP